MLGLSKLWSLLHLCVCHCCNTSLYTHSKGCITYMEKATVAYVSYIETTIVYASVLVYSSREQVFISGFDVSDEVSRAVLIQSDGNGDEIAIQHSSCNFFDIKVCKLMMEKDVYTIL